MHSDHVPRSPIAIVGAGLAGLAAAQALTKNGHTVRLFDKGRGPGGRMASRREPFLFDHGAQYFTVRDPHFQRQVEAWMREGVVQEWAFRLGVAAGGHIEVKERHVRRYVGVPRMSAITRHLASGLDLVTRTRVEAVTQDGDAWQLVADDGADCGRYETVLLTPPPVQAAALLQDAAPELAATVRSVTMQPCWAVLAAFDRRLETDFDALFIHDAPLSWVARNTSKPGRLDAECWVLHGSPTWSAAHLEEEVETVCDSLLGAFFETLGLEPVVPEYVTAHRWRYALAEEPLDAGYLYDADRGLGVGGDWCHGSRVEGAFLSGVALAERVELGRREDR